MPHSRRGSILPCLPINERKPIEVLQVVARGLEVGHHPGPPVPAEPLGLLWMTPTARGHGFKVPAAGTAPWHSSPARLPGTAPRRSRLHLIPGGQACDRPSPGSPLAKPRQCLQFCSTGRARSGCAAARGCCGTANSSHQVRAPRWGRSCSGHSTASTSTAEPPWHPAKVSHRRCAAISGARVPLSLPSMAPGSIN